MFSRDLSKGLGLPAGYLSQLLQIFSNNVSPNLLWFGVAASKTIFFVRNFSTILSYVTPVAS